MLQNSNRLVRSSRAGAMTAYVVSSQVLIPVAYNTLATISSRQTSDSKACRQFSILCLSGRLSIRGVRTCNVCMIVPGNETAANDSCPVDIQLGAITWSQSRSDGSDWLVTELLDAYMLMSA